METELQLQLAEIERKLKLLKDHKHTGSDFNKVNYSDLEGSSSSVYAKAYLNSAQATTGQTKVLLDTEVFSSGITFASNKFTILTAGKYLIQAKIGLSALPDAKSMRVEIYKGGALISRTRYMSSINSVDMYGDNVGLFNLAVGDYIELYVGHSNDPTSHNLITGEGSTEMSLILIS